MKSLSYIIAETIGTTGVWLKSKNLKREMSRHFKIRCKVAVLLTDSIFYYDVYRVIYSSNTVPWLVDI
ncbi:MAG TPA: hypothetical protein VIZ62_06350 [Nitrososphaeraceae archaeon]